MPDLMNIAEKIAADANGDEQIEAFVAWGASTEARAYKGEVESLAAAESAGIGVRVISSHRQGFAYVGSLSEEAAREALAQARDNALFATPDEAVGLAEPDGISPQEINLWRDNLLHTPTETKINLAIELDNACRKADTRIRQVTSSDYGDSAGEVAICSSLGIKAYARESVCYISTDVLVGEQDDTMSGSGYSVGREVDDLILEKAVNDAVVRSTRLLGAKKQKSAQLAVVLDKRVTATLISILAGTLSGEEVVKQRSLFAERLGDQVGIESFTLIEDPTNISAFGASAFDAEGLASRKLTLIDRGKLSGFLYDTYSARLAGTQSSASAVRAGYKSTPSVGAKALFLLPGELSETQIIEKVGNGFYVQEISGVHSGVNPISGDFSVGAEGLMIRNGQLTDAVKEVTIASTIQKMLQEILYIGNDTEWLPSSAAGVTLAIGDMSLSGS
ncbi:MAG: TldD/PmbA family protein [Firmicutes bacterium]|nr:TldD/PmbA family protein [Bacillota bacterium]